MADNRTMAQMLQAPIEGYEDAIVIPPINANNFELKQPLINLVQSNKFTGRQDPHNHLRFFNKVTSTFRHPEVPKTSVQFLDKMPQEGLAIIMNQNMNPLNALVVTTPAPVKQLQEEIPTKLQVQVLYQAIPFQILGTKPRQLQLVSGVSYDGPLILPRCGKESEVTKDTELSSTRHPTSIGP
ncbi:hypothetical protein Tco_1078777 [Tanacetum coccineum]|uniref:Reverse transcriptase domain-containing protein n=1 Tax=Tanacetum coccineum TaxID=301880 RepID=A0ABQ5HRI6_9ASTR